MTYMVNFLVNSLCFFEFIICIRMRMTQIKLIGTDFIFKLKSAKVEADFN